MEVPAEEFGDAGLTRRFCDRENCKNQIAIAFTSTDGEREYCSNRCRNEAEQEREQPDMTDEATATETAAPASKPKPATKKTAAAPAKKAAAKAAPPAKEKKAASNGNAKYTDEQIIHRLKDNADLPCRGLRAEAMKLLKEGQTIEKFKALVKEKVPSKSPTFILDLAVTGGVIKVSAK
jgi:hypothetical protein